MKFELSRDRARMDVDVIHGFLSACYWSPGIRRDLVEKTIRHSEVVRAFAGGAQVGFARAVTDYASFAWLCDVFVLDSHRGFGLARRMVRTLMDDPELQTLRRWCLATRDAEGVYRPLGFERIPPNGPGWSSAPRLKLAGPPPPPAPPPPPSLLTPTPRIPPPNVHETRLTRVPCAFPGRAPGPWVNAPPGTADTLHRSGSMTCARSALKERPQ